MKDFSRINRNGFFLAVLLCLLFGCTIIQSSDITSLDQLNKLTVKSIDITENLSTQSLTATATLVDSIMNAPVFIDINNTINGTVAKQTKITWPAVTSDSKLKFRSGVTTGIVIKNTYYQNGMPRHSFIYGNNLLKEWYSFYYDINFNLTNVRSRIFASPDTAVYRDSLIYNTSGFQSWYVSSIVRKSPYNPSKAGTINFTYSQYSPYVSLNGPVQYAGLQYNPSNQNCPNGTSIDNCFGSSFIDNASPNSSSSYVINTSQVGNLLNLLSIADLKINNNGGAPRNYDTYYFHPLMLMRNLFSHGNFLLTIYMIDWWQPGQPVSGPTNFTKNETVTFNFNYGQ